MHLLTEKSLETRHRAIFLATGSIINCNKSWPFKFKASIIWGVAADAGSGSGSIYGLSTIWAKSK